MGGALSGARLGTSRDPEGKASAMPGTCCSLHALSSWFLPRVFLLPGMLSLPHFSGSTPSSAAHLDSTLWEVPPEPSGLGAPFRDSQDLLHESALKSS